MQIKCQRCYITKDDAPAFCLRSLTGKHVWDVPNPEPTTPSVRDTVLEKMQGTRTGDSMALFETLKRQTEMVANTRPPFRTLFLDFAEQLSRRSTCARLQVGCVIASHDYRQVFSIGYNGNVTGGANDCDRHGPEAVGNCGCIHAEQNAVINCTAPRDAAKIVFCTHLPCVQCAKFLINLGGVVCVFYRNDYRIKDSLTLFDTHGIKHEHLP